METDFASQTARPFYVSKIGLWALCLSLICLPLLYPAVQPYSDVYGHIGRYHIQLNGSKASVLQDWYSFKWAVVPNLGHDILMQIFGPHFGVEPTAKYLIIASQIISAIGVLSVSKAVHGSVKFSAVLALPFLYHYAFIYGFSNYSLSLGLALCSFALWMKLQNKALLRILSFALISVIVFVCHIYGWAIMCILIGSHVLMQNIAAEKKLIRILWLTSRACLVLILPFATYYLFLSGAYDDGQNMFVYEKVSRKFGYIIMTVRDRWLIWDVATVLAAIAFIVFAIRSPKFNVDKFLALAALICIVLYVLMPTTLLGSAKADMRLMPVIFIFSLLMLRPAKSGGPYYMIAALIFASLRLGGNAVSAVIYDQDFRREYKLVEVVPDGSRMVSLISRPCKADGRWARDRKDHIPSLVLARKNVFANDQWATKGGHLLQVVIQNAGNFRMDPSFKIRPEHCPGDGHATLKNSVAAVPKGGFDYLWAINVYTETPGAEWEKIGGNETSALYRYIGAAP